MKEDLLSHSCTKWVGKKFKYLKTCTSTNVLAKEAGEEGEEHGYVIMADEQTAGRGRRGRVWQSPQGANIYFTILLRPSISPEKASMLTLVMAHSVAKAIEEIIGEQEASRCKPQIKWPNDILLSGKKVCGILTEMSVEKEHIHYVVCGVGINVARQEFAEEIKDTATALEIETGMSISKELLFAGIMEHFEKDYEGFMLTEDLSSLKDEYEKMLVNRGKEVRVLDPKGEWAGIAKGINLQGELLVENDRGETVHVYAGEVSVRGLQGYV